MNPETAHEDVRTVSPGAAVVYEESLGLKSLRDDVHFYPVPFQKLVLELVHDGKLRRLAVNMVQIRVLEGPLKNRVGCTTSSALTTVKP